MPDTVPRLRQVAWVAADLVAASQDVQRRLDLEVCYSDPGVATFGLENVLFPVGDQFLEIVSPTEEGTTAGRLLDKRGVDAAGYMVIFQTSGDLDEVRARAERLGIRIVFEAPGGSRADGTEIHGIHFHPADVGGAIVSIDHSVQPAEWAWAGPSWREHVRTGVVSRLVDVQIEVDDPATVADRWAQLLGATTETGDAGRSELTVDGSSITFVSPAEGAEPGGVVGFTFRGESDDEFELVGTKVRITRNSTGAG